MKTLLFICSIIFTVLTFIGAGYVLFNGGKVNAGYAIIPMLFGISCLQGYKTIKKQK